MDLDWGGDDVATVFFDDDEFAGRQGRPGRRRFPSAAISGRSRLRAFEIDASVGYKFVTTKANNADIHLSRTMLQLEGLYRWPNGFTLGAGLIQHMSPTLHGDGFLEDINFDDATGFNAEIGWRWISLHYANMTYSSDVLRGRGRQPHRPALHLPLRPVLDQLTSQLGRGPVDSRHTMR